jgi:AcrR family transcriptional regulator
MTGETTGRHSERSARTRSLFIEAAQRLFAERSVDSVSLNEITVAAGQKNRNALQYHFGDRNGLLQAIIDSHANRVYELRQHHLDRAIPTDYHLSRAAAQALVNPLAEYVEENPSAIYYVKILSQLAALNSPLVNPSTTSGLSFQQDERLAGLMRGAVAHLQPTEAQRRLFLVVSITFHSIADICRASDTSNTSGTLRQRPGMFDQVALAVESLLAAPPL